MLHTLLILGVGIAIVAVWHFRFQSRDKMKEWNFDWYRSEFPELIGPRGVQCYRCKSFNIGTEHLMQGTFLRAHICRQCGTKLYYSEE